MEFYTGNADKRPIRLSEATRQFAWESMHFRYGQEAMRNPAVSLDEVPGWEEMSRLERYDAAVRQIALCAPVRLCEGEMLSGSATLGLAIRHRVPATRNGETPFESVSHLTIDFPTVVKRGVDGIHEDVLASLKKEHTPREKAFLNSCLNTIESMRIWHGRYLDALKERPELRGNYERLLRVPFAPARNFHEAVQSIWFTFAFVRQCGNWPGIGRIDVMLGDFLRRDLQAGVLTMDEAREILAHFFIKGCEWIRGEECGSGDAQHYQNLVLAGVGDDGREVTNDVTYLVLDVIEELGISDFPTTLRLNRNTDEKLLRRAAEVVRFGGGVLAFYNEDLILRSLTQAGYLRSEAVRFANDGCWEVQIPGKTCFSYIPFDALRILQSTTLNRYAEGTDFPDFETLYTAFRRDLGEYVQSISDGLLDRFEAGDGTNGGWLWKETLPCTVVSLFEEGCVESGKSYFEGGPVYNVISPHIGGLPDVVNALYAIKKLVFEEHRYTFPALMDMLRSDWPDEAARQQALLGYSYFGNDEDECDGIAVRVLADFADACRKCNGQTGYLYVPGVSTFGRQLEWMPHRFVVPHGHRTGDVLAGNLSPTPGSDRKGATAIIRSYCKPDLSEMVTGAALDIRLLPSAMAGEDGLDGFVGLLRGFVLLGGCFVQPDVQDAKILKEAQEHPENYPTLSVRVSGWNARFVTLNREWQDMIINENNG